MKKLIITVVGLILFLIGCSTLNKDLPEDILGEEYLPKYEVIIQIEGDEDNLIITKDSVIISDLTNGGPQLDTLPILVPEGNTPTFSFTANEGFEVVSIIVDTTYCDVDSNYTYEPVYENSTMAIKVKPVEQIHTITITSGDNGHCKIDELVVTGDVTVKDGDSITVYFIADDKYQIESVTIDSIPQTEITASISFDSVITNHIVNVKFADKDTDPDPITNDKTISFEVSGGKGHFIVDSTMTSSLMINSDSAKTITINSDIENHYYISSIIVDGDTSVTFTDLIDSTYDLSIDYLSKVSTISVLFEQYSKVTTTGLLPNGTINDSLGDPVGETLLIKKGEEAQLTFKANDGYLINSLEINGSTVVSASSKVQYSHRFESVVDSVFSPEHTVTISFKKKEYSLTAKVIGNSGGKVAFTGQTESLENNTTVPHDGGTILYCSPEEHYLADSVDINGSTTKISGNTVPLTNITGDKEIFVSFLNIQDTISVSVPNGNGIVKYGLDTITTNKIPIGRIHDSKRLYIIPSNGYELDTIIASGGESKITINQDYGTECDIDSVNENINVEVFFKPLNKISVAHSYTNGATGTVSQDNTIWGNANDNVTYELNAGTGSTIDSIVVDGPNIERSNIGIKTSIEFPSIDQDYSIDVYFGKSDAASNLVNNDNWRSEKALGAEASFVAIQGEKNVSFTNDGGSSTRDLILQFGSNIDLTAGDEYALTFRAKSLNPSRSIGIDFSDNYGTESNISSPATVTLDTEFKTYTLTFSTNATSNTLCFLLGNGSPDDHLYFNDIVIVPVTW
jgi:hypothetical protein